MSSNVRHMKRWWLVLAAAVAVVGGGVTVHSLAQDEGRPRPHERRWSELSEDEVESLLEIVGERQPAAAERLRQLRESDPEQFRHAVRRLVDHERLRPLLMMRRSDPEGFELHGAAMRAKAQAERLRRQLQQAADARADELRQQLRQAAADVVDAEFKVREYELSQLRKRLEELRQDLAHRRQNRQTLIDQYYTRLTAATRTERAPTPDGR
jgi:DNA repair exonuclease SbcCD ATPase subunit